MKLPILATLVSCLTALTSTADISKPNIVYILADDMGYGDVQCLNPKSDKIATPHIDKVAEQGITFTDEHTSSSVCTTTRYSVLTGRSTEGTKQKNDIPVDQNELWK